MNYNTYGRNLDFIKLMLKDKNLVFSDNVYKLLLGFVSECRFLLIEIFKHPNFKHNKYEINYHVLNSFFNNEDSKIIDFLNSKFIISKNQFNDFDIDVNNLNTDKVLSLSKFNNITYVITKYDKEQGKIIILKTV